jgi:DNA mismatch repair protein MSH4
MLLTTGLEEYQVGAALKFDNGRKYWLLLKAPGLHNEGMLPEIFINVVRKRGKIECQTLDLVKLNLRLSDTSNEVMIRSDKAIHELTSKLRCVVPELFRICESVALADMISSFGQLATTRDYVRPSITGTLALKAARHPVLEKVGMLARYSHLYS